MKPSSFITFQSKAAADMIMHKTYAERILTLLHKTLDSGIVTAAETKEAIAILETELNQQPAAPNQEHAEEPRDAIKKENSSEIGFRTRVFPFLDMLRRAHKKQCDIVWWQ